MFVYGGAVQNGGLAPDVLHCLDLTKGIGNCYWYDIKSIGRTPGKRYGHSMAYLYPNIFIFGGNLGNNLSNDVWTFNVEDSTKNEWVSLEQNCECPPPRMYHSFTTCNYGSAKGMLIVFGGREESTIPTNDIWGFRKHRDGRWDWTKAPSTSFTPLKRFQVSFYFLFLFLKKHTAIFYYNFLIILGGRTEEELKETPIQVYDTETSDWFQFDSFNKFRHATWINDCFLYSHGGFDHSLPSVSKNDLVEIDLIKLLSSEEKLKKKVDNIQMIRSQQNKSDSSTNISMNNTSISKTTSPSPSLSPQNTKEIYMSKGMNNNTISNKMYNPQNQNVQNMGGNYNNYKQNYNSGKQSGRSNYNIKPIVVKEGEISTSSLNDGGGVVVKKVILDEKGKYKVNNDLGDEPLHDQFIRYLLNPGEWIKRKDPENQKFRFNIEEVTQLTSDAIEVVKMQPMVLKISTPCKVFGDIHGQYIDLMTFFYKWGEPKEGPNGDIMNVDYLFLGDYVDRGTMSLETICLLMALKIKYPNNIHLLRGNHEDRLINANFGFADECQIRLGEDPAEEDSVFNSINLFFEYLPLAAVIEDQIFCLHGGIGSSVRKISDIECIPRPLEVIHEATTNQQQTIMDILWSDPTDFDTELGILPNTQRDSNNYGNIVKFGPDIVKKFLQDNHLSYIIRAHECVLDGFERFAGGMLITVFSATDYCRRHDNAGAMLIIKNNFEIYPHLIYPPDGGNRNWMDDDEALKKRPPTPPRFRYNNRGNF